MWATTSTTPTQNSRADRNSPAIRVRSRRCSNRSAPFLALTCISKVCRPSAARTVKHLHNFLPNKDADYEYRPSSYVELRCKSFNIHETLSTAFHPMILISPFLRLTSLREERHPASEEQSLWPTRLQLYSTEPHDFHHQESVRLRVLGGRDSQHLVGLRVHVAEAHER